MSGSTEYALPFRRGSTYKDGSTLTLAATTGDSIVGRVYKTTDSNDKDLWLRAVRADAALTNVGTKVVSFTTGKVGKNVDALTNLDGEIAAVVDDAYATTKDIDQYDIFYVVEEGDVNVVADSGVTAEMKVMADASADGVIEATAGSFIIGFANEAAGATTAGIANIHVGGNLKPSDPAS